MQLVRLRNHFKLGLIENEAIFLTSNFITEWTSKPWIGNFFVKPTDPGYLYYFEHNGRYKIGKTTNPESRLRAARTWLPDINVIGIKPFWNVSDKERLLHVGLASYWSEGEWFGPIEEELKAVLIDDFIAFSDTDINNNSVNFIYWFNGSGMGEFVMEQNYQRKYTRKFQRDESFVRTRDD